MTLTFNIEKYNQLLTESTPQVIESSEEYDRIIAIVENLHFKKDKSAEERKLYKLLVALVELYETEHFPIPDATPREVLLHIMEASGTRQADLVGVLGSSGVVSEVVNGKRAISKAQAKALAARFKVSPDLFL
ncbi:MAG: transcriptional regulator [Leptolyngbya sp. UWPOB_LEPTO1]|uniref:helix-turn-helix domain-containing protein n=1 Tax=Leptolyngbya sp. UWPOB_LEPTO1 TaxID=2815653 RepID=UPI001AC4D895|nr:transcriptional regulator [Leptolyngbya sp. UWPOB_LEPTO1]MBN8559148.1 transcriptional regulator [Leptolyngbya sp. UWPOB_LEPTO1]